MAETKTESKNRIEREYVIPLRNEWRKVANYRRTGRAIKEIKKFIARHMKVPDRDISKVKLDIYLNRQVWFRGRRKPPAKIKVKAIKENDIVKVELAEMPSQLKFAKLKQEKRHKLAEIKKPLPSAEEKKEETPEKEEEKKIEEKEKAQSVAETKAKEAKQEAKAQKHTTKTKEPGFHRMALKK